MMMYNRIPTIFVIITFVVTATMIHAMKQEENWWHTIAKKAEEYRSLIPSDYEIKRVIDLVNQRPKEIVEIPEEKILPYREIDRQLIAAARDQNLRDIEEAIKEGADTNGIVNTLTPLAMSFNNPTIVEELIKHGADVNQAIQGISPLDWATLKFLADLDAFQKTRELLLEKGAVPTPKKTTEPQQAAKPLPYFRPR